MRNHRITVDGAELAVRDHGEGPPLVLLHGWPHTSALWDLMRPALERSFRVITPDLRGMGDSTRVTGPIAGATVAADLIAVLDALDIDSATVVAIDASVPGAFLAGMQHPDRVDRLVLAESLLMPLPGADAFLAGGPPWWFGFHGVPGLAEHAVAGNEDAYIGWFLRNGTRTREGVPAEMAAQFVDALRGPESLASSFGYYHSGAETAAAVAAATSTGRLTVPTLAVGGDTVGDVLANQLSGVTDTLTRRLFPSAGHILPVDVPDEFAALITDFCAGQLAG
ncbi:alpha/beta fold hydrolase [Nakamurella sp. YIM 132087]|uniref:Alpha/beta fold hydrolase n=1 Tax=Nakamurella alba TaxID=2665158 RepID=A0A7K1FSS1_9ACTN|nr:alpha/beta hydrolase [Nakamurella alba]MTD17161.1 alpha/beta fold hydrolase [Nakamurella alba]